MNLCSVQEQQVNKRGPVVRSHDELHKILKSKDRGLIFLQGKKKKSPLSYVSRFSVP